MQRRPPPASGLFPYTTLFRSQLEAQVLVVAQPPGDLSQVLAGEEQGELAAVDHDLLDRRVRVDALVLEQLDEHVQDRKSTRLNSSHVAISYAVFCLKKKRTPQ